MEELIIVKQLPIIEENLKKLSEEVKKKVENANSLICTEDTVKDVKKLRAEFNTEFKQLEEQRKNVKNQVMKPYNDFEMLYKEYVADSYKEADLTLKSKIDNVESELYLQKENELRKYFNEQKFDKHVGFVSFEQMNLNITLSASMKSLKEQIKSFCEKIQSELETINLQENKDEILVEYMKTLDINKSIKDVADRHVALEQVKKSEEKKEEVKIQEEQTIQKVEEVLQAPKIEEEKYKIVFSIIGTKRELSEIKKFLDNGGYKYDCE